MNTTGWPVWFCRVHDRYLLEKDDALLCPGGEGYPIRNGIPRFVPDSKYAAAFGAQWKRYRVTQLDSYTGTTISQNRVQRCVGDALWNELAGKHILECGCGAGRFSEVLLSRGGHVTSIDLSDAVEANAENCPQGERHRVAQADIMNLPFIAGQYDVVFCLGVIQHTPNPEATIASLYEQVRPGGYLIIDHYRYTSALQLFTNIAPYYHLYFRRLPPEKGITYTESLVKFFFPLHRMVHRIGGRSRIFARLLSRVSPVYCYYHTCPQLSDRLQFEWALLDTHDRLTSWYRHLRRREQIAMTLERLGLLDVYCIQGGNGIEARGRRPPL